MNHKRSVSSVEEVVCFVHRFGSLQISQPENEPTLTSANNLSRCQLTSEQHPQQYSQPSYKAHITFYMRAIHRQMKRANGVRRIEKVASKRYPIQFTGKHITKKKKNSYSLARRALYYRWHRPLSENIDHGGEDFSQLITSVNTHF